VVSVNHSKANLDALLARGPAAIAATLTAIEGLMYRCICPPDYIYHLRRFPASKRVAEARRTARRITYWVMREVLKPNTVQGRGKILKLFLAAANVSRDSHCVVFLASASCADDPSLGHKECWQRRNFSSAAAILDGIDSRVICRLPETLKELPARELKLLRRLSNCVASEEAYNNAVTATSDGPPCVPHLGVFLHPCCAG
jgi:hypothetical protein